MLPARQLAAYNRFYDAAHKNGILDRKTTLLLHTAAAMAFGCGP